MAGTHVRPLDSELYLSMEGWIEDAIYKAKPAGVVSSQTAAIVIFQLWTDFGDKLTSYPGRRNDT